MINVTKTFLPPIEEYIELLREIWASEHITNHGKCVLQLERELKSYLGVKHLFLVNNGTIALQIAIKALNLSGEIITTPFSYVATTSSIVWENCAPIFADIDKRSLCLNPIEAEKKITKNTTAILATHVYGIPCDVKAFDKLSKKTGVKIIYDAAHAFGVGLNGNSLLNWGDISTLSFHATKVFHTVEGGAVVTGSDELAKRISYMRNFGHDGPENFFGVGINGKASEFHAAMGIVNLSHINDIIDKRKSCVELYNSLLKGLDLTIPIQSKNLSYNYAYYPIIAKNESIVLKIIDNLKSIDVFPRRYFYPSLNLLPYVRGTDTTPVSEDISKRILCLPLYHSIKKNEIVNVCNAITETLKMD